LPSKTLLWDFTALDAHAKLRLDTRVKRRWILVLLAALLLDALLGFWWWRGWRERNYDALILAAARQYSVDPALVKAVVWRESRFDSRARGRKGEIGLMQIREEAAQEWAGAEGIQAFRHPQLFDPSKNTLAGTWYLGKLLKRYAATDNPVPYALADYNAGRANVRKWNKGIAATNSGAFIRQIDFPSTRDYVRSVMKQYARYRKNFPPQSGAPKLTKIAAPVPGR
jgi:soluble lytic murein transglycosylase